MTIRISTFAQWLLPALLAGTLSVSIPAAQGAEPGEMGLFKLQYAPGKPKVNPSFGKGYGGYLGSGAGQLQGKFAGQVAWDLYEEQSNSTLHRTQFVGWITAEDGSKIAFETSGYFIPRKGFSPRDGVTEIWDLTSAVYFSNASGQAYRQLAEHVGLWHGHLEIRGAEDQFIHTYHLLIPDEQL
jgi:hypothetical protein